MNTWHTGWIIIIIIFIIGCTTPLPRLDPLPAPEFQPYIVPPDPVNLTQTIVVGRTSSDKNTLLDNITVRNNLAIPENSRVVISMPPRTSQQTTNQPEASKRGRALVVQAVKGGDAQDNKATDMDNYLDIVEQQIEKSLIEKNLIVIDRAKFSVALQQQCYQTASQQDRFRETMMIIKEAVMHQLTSGLINQDQLLSELTYSIEKYTGAGERCCAGELVGANLETSELICVAQSPYARADYILEVNEFDTISLQDEMIFLSDMVEIKSLISVDNQLGKALERENYNTVIKPGYVGHLRAKLIEVTTGAIVWLGEHQIESQNVLNEGFSIEVPIRKEVANIGQLNRRIDDYNQELERLSQRLQNSRAEVLDSKAKNKIREVRANEYNHHRQLLLAKMDQGLVQSLLDVDWQFKYHVGQPHSYPWLPNQKEMDDIEYALQGSNGFEHRRLLQKHQQATRLLNNHLSELTKLVTKELMKTIPIMNNIPVAVILH